MNEIASTHTIEHRRLPFLIEDSVPVPGAVRPGKLDNDTVKCLPGDLVFLQKFPDRGSFTETYRIYHRRWGVPLLLKSLRPVCTRLVEEGEWLLGAWEKWVGLGIHLHVASAYSLYRCHDRGFLVTENIQGSSLRLHLETGQDLSLKMAMQWVLQCIDGLACIHSKGLVHGNVKLENCIVGDDLSLRLTDFGAPLLVPLRHWMELEEKKLLPAGSILKYAACKAPEQWDRSCGEIAPATDIYAAGMMLYELCCRRNPFKGVPDDPELLRDSILSAPVPPPHEVVPELPDFLSDFILACTAKNPVDRFATAREAGRRLASIYEKVTGEEPLCPMCDEKALAVDSSNNRGLDLLDHGETKGAISLWDAALTADSSHLPSLFNKGLVRWRNGDSTDVHILAEIGEVKRKKPALWEADFYQAMVHLERDDCFAARQILQALLIPSSYNREVVQALERTVELVSRSTRQVERIELSFQGRIESLQRNDKNTMLYAGCSDKALRIVELQTGMIKRTIDDGGNVMILVGVSSDGRHLLTQRPDGTLKLWDMNTGMAMKLLAGAHRPGNCRPTMSGDARMIATEGAHGTVRLWDLGMGKELRAFEGHGHPLLSLQFSGDDRYIFTGTREGVIGQWDRVSGECVKRFEGPAGVILFSRDGRVAFMADRERSLLYHMADEKVLWSSRSFLTSPARNLSMSENGLWLLTAEPGERGGQLWSTRQGRLARTLDTEGRLISAFLLGSDGSTAFIADDNIVRVWKIEPDNFSRQCTFAFSSVNESHVHEVSSLRYRKLIESVQRLIDDTHWEEALVMMSEARKAHDYECTAGVRDLWLQLCRRCRKKGIYSLGISRLLQGKGGIINARLSHDGALMASVHADYTVKLWDAESGENRQTFKSDRGFVVSLTISRDRKKIALGHSSGEITLIDLDLKERQCILRGHENKVNALSVSPDNRFLVSGSSDGRVKIWDLRSGLELRNFEEHQDYVLDVAWSPDSSRIFSASRDSTIRVWALPAGTCIKTLKEHTNPVVVMAVSADGKKLLSGGYDKCLICWDIESGKITQILDGIQGQVTALGFSLDGQWAAAVDFASVQGSPVNHLRIWSTSKGCRERECDLGLAGYVSSLYWSADGMTIGVGSRTRDLVRLSLEWELDRPGGSSWDDAALPYLSHFLITHRRYRLLLSPGSEASAEERTEALTREEEASWDDHDFHELMNVLGLAGFGWIPPEQVRDALKRL
jgi:WD40 repeat protein